MIRDVDRLWRKLAHQGSVIWESGTEGRLLLIACVLALGSVLVLGRPVVRDRASLKPVPLLSAIVSTAVMLGSCFWLIRGTRRFFLSVGPHDPLGATVRRVFADSSSAEELAINLAGLVLFAIAAASVLIALRARGSRTIRAVVVVCAALVMVTAWIGQDKRVTFYWNASYWPPVTYPLLRAELAESHASLVSWQLAIIAMAVVGAIVCVGFSLRDALPGLHTTNRGALGAALLLSVAIAAFAATRPAAADVRLRIPHISPDERCYLEPSALAPIVGGCVGFPPGSMPIVEVPGPRRNFELGQTPVNGLVLTGKRLIRQIREKRGQSIGLVVDRDVSVASIDWAQIREAGYDSVLLYMHAPAKRLETRTIGVVSLWARCCAVEMRLDGTGEPAEAYATYGDLVRAATAASQRGSLLTLAP